MFRTQYQKYKFDKQVCIADDVVTTLNEADKKI